MVLKTCKIEIQKGGTGNSDFLHNWFFRESRSFLFNLHKFQNSSKRIPESCRISWNLMNDQDYGPIKLSNLKCRKADQIIRISCKISSSEKLRSRSLICRNFKTLRKVLLIMQDVLKSNEWRKIWVLKTSKIQIKNDEELGSLKVLKLKYRRRDQIIQTFSRIGSPKEIRFPAL